MPKDHNTAEIKQRRFKNALWGLFIADAPAMPARWYYNLENIQAVCKRKSERGFTE